MLLGDLDIGDTIMVSLVLKYVVSAQTLFGSGLARVLGSCEHDNGPSSSNSAMALSVWAWLPL